MTRWGEDRHFSPLRRTPLKRRTTLKAGGELKRKTWIQPVSHKRKADKPRRDAVRQAVFERDGYRCQIAPLVDTPCFGVLTPHHLKKASAGGEYVESNLIAACSYHNSWVENWPEKAKALGLVA